VELSDGDVQKAAPWIKPHEEIQKELERLNAQESELSTAESGEDVLSATGLLRRALTSLSEHASDWGRRAAVILNLRDRNLDLPLSPFWPITAVAIWLALGGMRIAHLLWQVGVLRKMKRTAVAAPPHLELLFQHAVSSMSAGRRSDLGISNGTETPLVVGFRNPRVLLPAGMCQEESGKIEQVFRHELAHVARRDDWANLFQQFIAATFFFHPGVWWLSRRITTEREIACDDHVLERANDRRSYALFLTEFASRGRSRAIAAAPAAWSSSSQLKERITMILDNKRNASPRLSRGRAGAMAFAAALVAVLGFAAAPRVTLAHGEEENATATTSANAAVSSISAVNENANDTVSANPKVTTHVSVITAPGADGKAGGLVIASSSSGHASISTDDITIDDDSGPKKKSKREGSDSDDTAPGRKPVPSVSPIPPVAPADISHGRRPDGPRDERSLERRMERLERMMEKLLAEKKAPQTGAPQAGSYAMPGNDFHFDMKMPKFDWKSSQLSQEQLDRIRDQAKRDAERAQRDVERAKRDAERTRDEMLLKQMRDSARNADQDAQMRDHSKDGLNQMRRALESQRNALEQQRRSIEKQLAKLEEKLGDLNDDQVKWEQKLQFKIEKDKQKNKEKKWDDNSERPEKPEKLERPEKPEKPEKSEKPERPEALHDFPGAREPQQASNAIF
jgi:beta-lactamase regulating signal transducer with metallopeptidase domain